MFVSGSKDSTLKVWDIRTRKLKVDLPGHADEVRGASLFVRLFVPLFAATAPSPFSFNP